MLRLTAPPEYPPPNLWIDDRPIKKPTYSRKIIWNSIKLLIRKILIIDNSIYMFPTSLTLDSKNSVHCCVKIRREREREANKVAGPDRDTRDLNED